MLYKYNNNRKYDYIKINKKNIAKITKLVKKLRNIY